MSVFTTIIYINLHKLEVIMKDLILPLLKIDENCLSEDLENNTITLTVPTGIHFLNHVLYDLPKGVFIDKQICGTGGTTLAIKSPTNYVIAVHRNILVENKELQHEKLLIKVNQDVPLEKLIKELQTPGKNKIISTYDGLIKVAKALEECGKLDQYHLLVDEVQNVIREGGDFRDEVCNSLLENSCKFASVSYLTATSTKREYLPVEIKDIPYLKIDWEDSVNIKVNQKHVKGDLTEVITSICLDHLDNPDKGEAYFFFNSIKGFIPAIKNLMKLRKATVKDIKIICANNDENVKLLNSIGKGFVPEKPVYGVDKNGKPIIKNRTITFITKTCFEGVDYYSDNPNTYIVSDARNKHKHFVKTDIAIDIRQIAGRFRTDNPMVKQEVTLLWTGQYEGYDMSEDEYKAVVLNNIEKAKNTVDLFNKGEIDAPLDFFAKTSKYYTKSNGVVTYNKLAFSNIMSEYETQYEDFKVVVENGKELKKVDVVLNKLYDTDSYEPPSLSLMDKSSLGKKPNFKELAQDYFSTYTRLKDCNEGSVNCVIEETEDLKKTVESIINVCPRLGDYIDELGVDVLRSCGFQESKIKRKYLSSVGAAKVEYNPSRIYKILKYKEGDRYTLKQVKDSLTFAYSKLKMQGAAKAKDIEKYYHVKRTNINGSSGYKIGGEI